MIWAAHKKVLVLVFLVCYNVICSSLFYGFDDPYSNQKQVKKAAKAFRYQMYKEVRQMSRKCEICGKGQVSGNNVSHSNRHTRRKWNANIQSVKVNEDGTVRKAKVCTRCLRSGKVNRAI